MPQFEVTAAVYVKLTVEADSEDQVHEKVANTNLLEQQVTETEIQYIREVKA